VTLLWLLRMPWNFGWNAIGLSASENQLPNQSSRKRCLIKWLRDIFVSVWHGSNNGGKTMPRKSQKAQILASLKSGVLVTPQMALKKWGCFRLAARINDLRDEGYRIQTYTAKKGRSRHAVYWLHDC